MNLAAVMSSACSDGHRSSSTSSSSSFVGSIIIAFFGISRSQTPGCVTHWTSLTVLGAESIAEETFGAQLTEAIPQLPVHPRWTGHAQLLAAGLPSRRAGSGTGRSADGRAVRNELLDLPVNALLVADVCGRLTGELLIELVLRVADRAALLPDAGDHTRHLAVGQVGHFSALLRGGCSSLVSRGG